jgi:hypothetical protein
MASTFLSIISMNLGTAAKVCTAYATIPVMMPATWAAFPRRGPLPLSRIASAALCSMEIAGTATLSTIHRRMGARAANIHSLIHLRNLHTAPNSGKTYLRTTVFTLFTAETMAVMPLDRYDFAVSKTSWAILRAGENRAMTLSIIACMKSWPPPMTLFSALHVVVPSFTTIFSMPSMMSFASGASLASSSSARSTIPAVVISLMPSALSKMVLTSPDDSSREFITSETPPSSNNPVNASVDTASLSALLSRSAEFDTSDSASENPCLEGAISRSIASTTVRPFCPVPSPFSPTSSFARSIDARYFIAPVPIDAACNSNTFDDSDTLHTME